MGRNLSTRADTILFSTVTEVFEAQSTACQLDTLVQDLENSFDFDAFARPKI